MVLIDYILKKKEDIKELKVFERDIDFPKTTSVAISVIGPRRAGKTFSLYNFIKKEGIKDEDFVFVNFEDDEIRHLKFEEKRKIIEAHLEIYKKFPKFVFLDEIQNLEDWQSFVYSLVEKKRYYIFITGSSSKLLSKEISTQLRGRSLNVIVFPFSFKEYLRLNNFEIEYPLSEYKISKIKGFLREYLLSTGFPQVLIDKLPPKTFLKEYVEIVTLRDIIERYKVKNVYALRFLISKMISNFAKEFSINKVYNELKSLNLEVGKGILYTYFSYIEEVFLAFTLRKFYFSEKQSKLSIPKVYVCDLGLPNYVLETKYSEDLGRLIENYVFLELKKKQIKQNFDLFYLKLNDSEVDFLIKEGLNIKQLIQVTYASNKDEIEKREIKALEKAYELFKKDNPELIIITWDYEDVLKYNNLEIKCIPLWKWLLNI